MASALCSRKKSPPVLRLSLLVTLILVFPGVSKAACTVCPGGETIQVPEKKLSIPGLEWIDSCGTLDGIIGAILQDAEDPLCTLIQGVSTLCGCPTPSNACELCDGNDGTRIMAYPEKQIPILFQDLFQGFVPTCEMFEAYLRGTLGESNSTCPLAQSLLGEFCGCGDNQNDSASSIPADVDDTPSCQLCPTGEPITSGFNISLGIDGFPIQTCGELQEATPVFLKSDSAMCDLIHSISGLCGCAPTNAIESPCSLCYDGSPVPNVSQPVPLFEFVFGFIPTCGLVETYLKSISDSSDECLAVSYLANLCGCPAVPDHCNFCDPDDTILYPDKVLTLFSEYVPFSPTCELTSTIQYQVHKDDRLCHGGRQSNFLCGCNDGRRTFWGADTVKKQAVLSWVPRISAFLSFCGSFFILWDTLRDKNKRSKTYHQLLCTMSVADIVSSIGWFLSTWAMPVHDEYGFPTNFYGASGNQITCKIQGFFIQLGFTSILYNFTLCLYYALVIMYGWKENQLKKIRLFLHSPSVVGLALACAGIPFYDVDYFGCYIQPYPLASDFTLVSIFAFGPISFVIFFATIVMIMIYLKVRADERASAKWRKGKSTGLRLEQQVLHQSLFFLGGFYISWPVLMASNMYSTLEVFYFWILVLILAPLQGLNNFLIYIRPRVLKQLRARKKERERAAKKKERELLRKQREQLQNSTEDVNCADAPDPIVEESDTPKTSIMDESDTVRSRSSGSIFSKILTSSDIDPSANIADPITRQRLDLEGLHVRNLLQKSGIGLPFNVIEEENGESGSQAPSTSIAPQNILLSGSEHRGSRSEGFAKRARTYLEKSVGRTLSAPPALNQLETRGNIEKFSEGEKNQRDSTRAKSLQRKTSMDGLEEDRGSKVLTRKDVGFIAPKGVAISKISVGDVKFEDES